MNGVWEGIVIGAFGGAFAGLTLKIADELLIQWRDNRDKKAIYEWMQVNSVDEKGRKFRSTRAIASFNNLTEDRVLYLCSHHPKIYQSTGKNEGMWAIHGQYLEQ